MLATVQVLNNLRQPVGIAYHVFRRALCVFTQLDDAVTQGSSINYAERMIHAIASAEKREIASMRYFDLQTRTAYGPGCFGSRPNPGDFEFDEVVIKVHDDEIDALDWVPTRCPQNVIEVFKMFIDGIPHQAKSARVPKRIEF